MSIMIRARASFIRAAASGSMPGGTAAVMAVDNYPVSDGPVGSVDAVRLQRVANVMHQFLPFPQFSISTMLKGSG